MGDRAGLRQNSRLKVNSVLYAGIWPSPHRPILDSMEGQRLSIPKCRHLMCGHGDMAVFAVVQYGTRGFRSLCTGECFRGGVPHPPENRRERDEQ